MLLLLSVVVVVAVVDVAVDVAIAAVAGFLIQSMDNQTINREMMNNRQQQSLATATAISLLING